MKSDHRTPRWIKSVSHLTPSFLFLLIAQSHHAFVQVAASQTVKVTTAPDDQPTAWPPGHFPFAIRSADDNFVPDTAKTFKLLWQSSLRLLKVQTACSFS